MTKPVSIFSFVAQSSPSLPRVTATHLCAIPLRGASSTASVAAVTPSRSRRLRASSPAVRGSCSNVSEDQRARRQSCSARCGPPIPTSAPAARSAWSPRATLSLSTDLHLNVLNNGSDLMYL
jgi:hypothetical protein